jgi:hypothetical protein
LKSPFAGRGLFNMSRVRKHTSKEKPCTQTRELFFLHKLI